MTKLVAIIVILIALAVAISVTTSELWLGIWLVLFILLGIPVLLLSIGDLIDSFGGSSEKQPVVPAVIHVTAVFACLIGFLLYKLAEWSEHPMADKHADLPLIFVAIVYGVPLIMWIRGKATEAFFRAASTEETLEAPRANDQADGSEREE
ncbi:MAG: hypothetical protein QNI99_19230 [Woeseiaceae bacterium]|nr:hypothetical protein [Woeseiaceae bacterium]